MWQVVNRWGGEAAVVHNKGALMVLPAGANKGTGLQRLLWICGLSTHNLVSFGDAENDLSLLDMSEFAVTVADAVPALKMVADLVAGRPGPAGVLGDDRLASQLHNLAQQSLEGEALREALLQYVAIRYAELHARTDA